MEPEEIETLTRRIKSMRADIEEFSDEFEKLSDAQLKALVARERERAEEAAWKADGAETALQLRKLSAVFNQTESS